MNIAIWDLDNCLSSDEWRIPLIRWDEKDLEKRYLAYHDECDIDLPANLLVFNAMRMITAPLFFTARPESVRRKTEEWIKHNLKVESPIVLMREEHNRGGAVEIKRMMFMKLILSLAAKHFKNLDTGEGEVDQQIDITNIIAFDDRLDIVEMYHALGIRAQQLKIHDVCAMTPPGANV